MSVRRYQDLKVWQHAIDLTLESYDLTDRFPPHERFGLTSQIRRAAVSIPSNIAEGQGRAHRPEFLNFLSIARGSLQELETLLVIAERRHYLPEKQLVKIRGMSDEVSRMLSGLRRALKR
jgi:four helix bundle protein